MGDWGSMRQLCRAPSQSGFDGATVIPDAGFDFQDYESLCAANAVCKDWSRITADEQLWQSGTPFPSVLTI
jgi:hypothetical protein